MSSEPTVAGGTRSGVRRVLLAGGSGTIGSALAPALAARGVAVRSLVRREPRTADEVRWDPAAGALDASALDGVDAIVNLSGASVGRIPWTPRYRRQLASSRLDATATLVAAMEARASAGESVPGTLVNASAVGVYGTRPGEVLDEDSAAGVGFFPALVTAWEAEARTAPEGVRVVLARSGVVLAPSGGALAPIRLVTKLGLGSRLGPGSQRWSWIALDDEVAALTHLLLDSDLAGPINLVAGSSTSLEVTRAVARLLHRPHLLVLPSVAIRMLMGEAGVRLLLDDLDVRASRLGADGFRFSTRELEPALAAALRG